MILHFHSAYNKNEHFMNCAQVIDVIVDSDSHVTVVSTELDDDQVSLRIAVMESEGPRVLEDWQRYHGRTPCPT